MQTPGVSRSLEHIGAFMEAWPSGVAVSRSGRIFVGSARPFRGPGHARRIASISTGNAVVRRYGFGRDVGDEATYLNDVVIDDDRGPNGTTYIS